MFNRASRFNQINHFVFGVSKQIHLRQATAISSNAYYSININSIIVYSRYSREKYKSKQFKTKMIFAINRNKSSTAPSKTTTSCCTIRITSDKLHLYQM